MLFGNAAPFNQASTTPLVMRSLSSSVSTNLMRYLRWKITANGSGLWDATFRVRVVGTHNSSFVPTQLSGCKLWLRADMGITLNGTTVSAWADQSGNGVSLAQSTATKQPTFQPSVAGVLNGMPVLSFSQGALQILASTLSYTNGGAASVFSAVAPSAGTFLNTRIFETLNGNGYYLGMGNGTSWRAIINGTWGTAAGTTANGNYLVSIDYDGAHGTLYQNGQALATDTYPSPAAVSNPYTVGGFNGGATTTDFWNGYIGEVIFFNRALTSNEVTRMHRYLGGRYNVAVP